MCVLHALCVARDRLVFVFLSGKRVPQEVRPGIEPGLPPYHSGVPPQHLQTQSLLPRFAMFQCETVFERESRDKGC